ncbi:MAG: hypothetical protein OEV40_12235 [Acidimicrobiia bacterium]|nr:hypothetical protein [Acidimicrobiia bacterium]
MSTAFDREPAAGGPDRGGAPKGQRNGPFAVSTVALALLVWPVAFNLGVYGEVFYEDVFRFVVAASATLGVAIVASSPSVAFRWPTLVALGAPAAWLAAAVVLFDSTVEAASDPVLGTIGLIVAVVAVPVALRVLFLLFNPEFGSAGDTRLLIGAATIVVGAALAGFVVGANHDAFLICDDFKVAGADVPTNCVKP